MVKLRGDASLQRSYLDRPLPKMPEGYYSGDKPNPKLRAFVDAHLRERPYDPATDSYDVAAFGNPIEATKRTSIYSMHSYHQGKKPHDAIRQYIRHYTREGDLVLDPFCGSGSTAVAALMEGRKVIAIDRSPAATFIAKNYCTPIAIDELRATFEAMRAAVREELDWLYETRCDRCGGPATTAYTVFSQTFQCPRCLSVVPIFDCVEVTGRTLGGKPAKIKVCPHCYGRGCEEEISTRGNRLGSVPVVAGYACKGKCRPSEAIRRHDDADHRKRTYFEEHDLGKIREIDAADIPHWYPNTRMMHAPTEQERWGTKWRAGTSNFHSVEELFTKRNLWALSAYYHIACENHNRHAADVFLFGLNSILLAMSRMQGYVEDPRFPNQLMRGTYYTPGVGREYNVSQWLDGKLSNLISGYSILNTEITKTQILISTQSAADLSALSSLCCDYIFTDPPYGGSVQYGELNFVWESWLRLDTHWHSEEIIVNEVRGSTELDWSRMMREAMAECYRVLKPGRWLSLCYHDTSEGTWALIQDIMAEVGFLADRSDSALFIDTQQKSYNQRTADKVTKRDLVINFRKPLPGEARAVLTVAGEEDGVTFTEKIGTVIREFLASYPGTTKDRVYDEVVSRMVREGRMEPHNFDELLAQVAEPVREPVWKNLFENEPPNLFGTHEIVRWYLREGETTAVDAAESAKEDAAAKNIADFIGRWLSKNPSNEGVHYSDIFEYYIYAVKDKPRRQLQDWLLDYFYKTPDGTYRPPAGDEESEAKAHARAAGTNRRIKRHVAYIQQGGPVPEKERPSDATLAEWIRQCKRTGLFEQGKLLYEKGGLKVENLSEEALVNVEEDYQVCVRMLNRIGKS